MTSPEGENEKEVGVEWREGGWEREKKRRTQGREEGERGGRGGV